MVSIGVSCDDDPGAILGLVFFWAEALVAGDTGVAGVASADFSPEAGSGVSVAGADSEVGSGVETRSGSGFFAREALADLVSPAFGGFLLFRVTSIQPSSVLG